MTGDGDRSASGLGLETRAGLPEALQVLLPLFPRGTWEGHDNFGGLVAFWLSRHVMFRRLTERLRLDTEAVLSGEADPARYKARLAQLGSMLVNQLHGHHQIEDHHYFPRLVGLETRLSTGFDLLDADHHALDGHLDTFADCANGVITGEIEPGRLRDTLVRFDTFLDRHLTDEEDLIVPVILKHGPEALE